MKQEQIVRLDERDKVDIFKVDEFDKADEQIWNDRVERHKKYPNEFKQLEEARSLIVGDCINTTRHYIRIINVDLEKPVTEDEWHLLAEDGMYLRNTSVMEKLLKNTFPDAENIKSSPNYVEFTLSDIKCRLPTSKSMGIEVDLSWYKLIEKPMVLPTIKQYIKDSVTYGMWESCFNAEYPKYREWKKWKKKLYVRLKFTKKNEWLLVSVQEYITKEIANYLSRIDKFEEDCLEKFRTACNFTKIAPALIGFVGCSSKIYNMDKYFTNTKVQDVIDYARDISLFGECDVLSIIRKDNVNRF